MLPARIYVFDTNSLIHLDRIHGSSTEMGAWQWLQRRGQQGIVRVPTCVFGEYKNDDRVQWYKDSGLVWPHTQLQDDCLAELMAALPDFVDASKVGSDADQPLVAYAMALNLESTGDYCSGPARIVSYELPRKPPATRIKVPDACAYYGIECITVMDMLVREGCFTLDT